jgi:hypothetical protein
MFGSGKCEGLAAEKEDSMTQVAISAMTNASRRLCCEFSPRQKHTAS